MISSTTPIAEPILVDRKSLARALSISVDVVDRLRRIGLPYVQVPGTTKRVYDPVACKAWMEGQNGEDAPELSASAAKQDADAIFGD